MYYSVLRNLTSVFSWKHPSTILSTFLIFSTSISFAWSQTAHSLLLHGNTYYNDIDKRDSSIYLMEAAMAQYEVEGKIDTMMEAVFAKGQFLNTERSPNHAIDWLHQIRNELKSKLNERHGHWLYLYYQLANAHSIMNNIDSALYYIDRNKELLQHVQAPTSIVTRTYNLDAWTSLLNRAYNRGIVSAKKGYQLALENNLDNPGVPNHSLYVLACLYHYASKQDSALLLAKQHHQNNASIYGETSSQYASSHNLLAAIYNKMLNSEKSISHYKHAETIFYQDFLRTGQLYNLTLVRGNIGLMYFGNNEFQLAEKYCKNALDLEYKMYESTNEVLLANQSRLAQIYAGLDQEQKALEYINKMKAVLKANQSATLYTKAHYNNLIGHVYFSLEMYQKSLEYCEKSLAQYNSSEENADNYVVAPLLNNGNVYKKQGKLDAARDQYLTALKIYDELDTYKNFGRSEFLLALSSTFNEIDLNKSELLVDSCLVVMMGNDNGRSFSSNLRDIRWHPKLLEVVSEKLNILSLQDERHEDILDIVKVFDLRLSENIAFVRTQYRLNQIQTFVRSIYDHFIISALETNQVEEAFRYAERVRALTIRLSLNGASDLSFAGFPVAVQDKLSMLESKVKKTLYNESLNTIEAAITHPDSVNTAIESYREYKKFVQREYPSFFHSKFGLPLHDADRLKDMLKKDEVILSFRYLQDDLIVFILNSQEINYHRYSNSKQDSLVELIYHKSSSLADIKPESQYLYNTLISPIQEKIEDKNLIIVPDGKLHYLSFDILLDEAEDYLIQSNDIQYAISVDLLSKGRRGSRRSDQILAFAPGFLNNQRPGSQTDLEISASDSLHHFAVRLPHTIKLLGIANKVGMARREMVSFTQA